MIIHMEEYWFTPSALNEAGSPSIKVFQAAVIAKLTGRCRRQRLTQAKYGWNFRWQPRLLVTIAKGALSRRSRQTERRAAIDRLESARGQ